MISWDTWDTVGRIGTAAAHGPHTVGVGVSSERVVNGLQGILIYPMEKGLTCLTFWGILGKPHSNKRIEQGMNKVNLKVTKMEVVSALSEQCPLP